MGSVVKEGTAVSGALVTDESLDRFREFVGDIALQTYPEAESAVHTSITREQLRRTVERFSLPRNAQILDVGCGQGPALDALREMGFEATGITVNEEDLAVCRAKGHAVRNMDQSFLDFPSGSFDLVWARHCIEHSFMPLFTLSGFKRVLKPGGHLYVEVPAPGTCCKHEENLNHYSVLSKTAWRSLLLRSGFMIDAEDTIALTTPAGPDEYYLFLCSTSDPAVREATNGSATGTLYLALSDGQYTGWGVCSKNLRREFERRLGVVDLIASRPPDGTTRVAGPLLTAIGDRQLAPASPFQGTPTFGYTFVENTLGEKAVENAGRYKLIFCGSTWCRDNLAQAGIDHVDILVQGVDTTRFRPLEPRQDDGMFVIFSGGKFEYRKGQDIVLKALRVLQEKHRDIVLMNSWRNVWPVTMNLMKVSKHITFELEGNTWPEQMEHLYRRNGIDHRRIITLDLVPNEMMPQLFARTDLGIFPNRCEGGTNLVMMEYMACGKPVIATNFSGHRDIVTQDNALLMNHLQPHQIVQEGNVIAEWIEPSVDELVALVEHAYHHRDEIRGIGRKASTDLRRFTWDAAAQHALSAMGLASTQQAATHTNSEDHKNVGH